VTIIPQKSEKSELKDIQAQRGGLSGRAQMALCGSG